MNTEQDIQRAEAIKKAIQKISQDIEEFNDLLEIKISLTDLFYFRSDKDFFFCANFEGFKIISDKLSRFFELLNSNMHYFETGHYYLLRDFSKKTEYTSTQIIIYSHHLMRCSDRFLYKNRLIDKLFPVYLECHRTLEILGKIGDQDAIKRAKSICDSGKAPEMLEIPKEPSKEKERERLDNLTERMEMLSSTLARFSIFIDDNREKLKKDDFYRLGALSAKIEEVEKFFFDIWGEVPSRFPDYTTKDEG